MCGVCLATVTTAQTSQGCPYHTVYVLMHEFPILSKIMFFKFRTLIDHILCSFEICLIVGAESSANQFRKKTNFPTMYKNFDWVIAKLVLI